MGSRDTVTGHFPSFVRQADTIQDLTRDTVPDGVVRGRNKPLAANSDRRTAAKASVLRVTPVVRTSDGSSGRFCGVTRLWRGIRTGTRPEEDSPGGDTAKPAVSD